MGSLNGNLLNLNWEGERRKILVSVGEKKGRDVEENEVMYCNSRQ
jgi:hypothetical protein